MNMKSWILTILCTVSCLMQVIPQPISLHEVNPHYLKYQGDPILLITSAEHYGAVLNLDFDYETYLDALHRDGMNYTRIFTGDTIARLH